MQSRHVRITIHLLQIRRLSQSDSRRSFLFSCDNTKMTLMHKQCSATFETMIFRYQKEIENCKSINCVQLPNETELTLCCNVVKNTADLVLTINIKRIVVLGQLFYHRGQLVAILVYNQSAN